MSCMCFIASREVLTRLAHDPSTRNSIENHGMTMMPSIHYGVQFNNAQWNPAAQHSIALHRSRPHILG